MNAEQQNQLTNLPIVGILGDGQLAMMMAQAYQKLGGRVCIMASSDSGPASFFADKVFVGDLADADTVAAFFGAVDVITLENEFNDAQTMQDLMDRHATPIYPDPSRFKLIEDKLSEKRFFESLDIDVADYVEVREASDIPDAEGFLKLAKNGYDGLGTYHVRDREQALQIFEKLKSVGTVLFEHAVRYQKELSLIGVSDQHSIAFYPLVETEQEDGTCRYVSYPAAVDTKLEAQAQDMVKRVLETLNTKGLFAFEFFLTDDNRLILNESAPRPHNSGHITLDLADCSQFENHMRSIAGLPLIEPKMLFDSMTMVNLLATKEGDFDEPAVLARVNDEQASVTLYRKKKSRVKRKVGHINVWGDNQRQRADKLIQNLDI